MRPCLAAPASSPRASWTCWGSSAWEVLIGRGDLQLGVAPKDRDDRMLAYLTRDGQLHNLALSRRVTRRCSPSLPTTSTRTA